MNAAELSSLSDSLNLDDGKSRSSYLVLLFCDLKMETSLRRLIEPFPPPFTTDEAFVVQRQRSRSVQYSPRPSDNLGIPYQSNRRASEEPHNSDRWDSPSNNCLFFLCFRILSGGLPLHLGPELVDACYIMLRLVRNQTYIPAWVSTSICTSYHIKHTLRVKNSARRACSPMTAKTWTTN